MKTMKRKVVKTARKERAQKDVIARRRSCDLKGTGLSHYVLMDNRKK